MATNKSITTTSGHIQRTPEESKARKKVMERKYVLTRNLAHWEKQRAAKIARIQRERNKAIAKYDSKIRKVEEQLGIIHMALNPL